MLLLVFPDGHLVSLVKQNISRLQYWICKQADRCCSSLTRFVFELCHPLQFAEAGKAVQNPRKFGMLADVRLHK
jgi:hypothetical protein